MGPGISVANGYFCPANKTVPRSKNQMKRLALAALLAAVPAVVLGSTQHYIVVTTHPFEDAVQHSAAHVGIYFNPTGVAEHFLHRRL